MSYILEALKKLEQKQRREEGTLLLSDHHAGAAKRRQPPWVYLLVLALVLNAGLLLWWLHPWRQMHSERDALRSTAEISDEPSGRTLSGSRGKRQENALPLPATEVPGENFPADIPRQQVVQREKSRAAEVGQSSEPAAAREVTAVPAGRPIDMSQLPPGLKQGLPDLTISGHFFDTAPSHRLVILGGHTLHEGQSVSPGLTLEQITHDGVVLNYRGTRFRKGVF